MIFKNQRFNWIMKKTAKDVVKKRLVEEEKNIYTKILARGISKKFGTDLKETIREIRKNVELVKKQKNK